MNYIQQKVKRKLILENAGFNSINNPIFSSLTSKQILKYENIQTIILHAASYGCVTWFLAPREEHILRVRPDVL